MVLGLDLNLNSADRNYAVNLVRATCRLAGSTSYLDDLRTDLRNRGVAKAVQRHDTAAIFDWLVEILSFQGVSDTVAAGYMRQHGLATWRKIEKNLGKSPSCPKLKSSGISKDAGTTRAQALAPSPIISRPARCQPIGSGMVA